MERIYLGQRVQVEGKGYGTVVAFGRFMDKIEELWVRVELDGEVSHWFKWEVVQGLRTVPAMPW